MSNSLRAEAFEVVIDRAQVRVEVISYNSTQVEVAVSKYVKSK